MSIRNLRTFLAVARHGTFAATGEAIGLTHSAISLQIKALEDDLQVTLFDRSKRPPVLTPEGRLLIEHARDIVERYDRMGGAVSTEQSLSGRTLIGAVPSILSGLLPPALQCLQEKHPRLQIDVASGLAAELSARVEAGELDAALVCDPMSPLAPTLKWNLVATEPLYVVTSMDVPGRKDRDILEAHPYIRFNSRTWTGRFIDSCLSRRSIAVRHRMELDSMEAIATMVAHGLGVSILPARPFAARVSARVRRVPFGDPVVRRKVGLVERRASAGRGPIAALLDELKAIARTTKPA